MVAARNAPFGPVKSKQALITAGMEFEINVTVEELGFKLDTSSGGVPQMERLQDLTVSLSLYGYGTLFIYMEDTFVVENEPFLVICRSASLMKILLYLVRLQNH